MPLDKITAAAVRQACDEFDRFGRDAFLARYGFRPARSYFLVIDDHRYDSKAIAGAAHGYALPDLGPLPASAFSGGEQTVARRLEALGFQVAHDDKGARNPPWLRDELILALDLYMTNPRSLPGRRSREVAELSDLLNTMARQLGHPSIAKYRNPTGVSMKMQNFSRFDPALQSRGRTGLTHGNRLEPEIWDEFANDLPRLRAVAASIRTAVRADEFSGPTDEDDEGEEAPEGRLLTRLHTRRERNRGLVEKAKARALKKLGRLACVACGFCFEDHYGDRGAGFIECHHTKPVHTLTDGAKTSVNDLALVCANCHRMIHARRPWLTVEELRLFLPPPG